MPKTRRKLIGRFILLSVCSFPLSVFLYDLPGLGLLASLYPQQIHTRGLTIEVELHRRIVNGLLRDDNTRQGEQCMYSIANYLVIISPPKLGGDRGGLNKRNTLHQTFSLVQTTPNPS